jgi:hypothetical protein
MASTVWHDNRYVTRRAEGVGLVPVLVPYYTQHFLLFTQFSSGMSHALDLTGLMSARPAVCPGSDGLRNRAPVEIWSIGYGASIADLPWRRVLPPHSGLRCRFQVSDAKGASRNKFPESR